MLLFESWILLRWRQKIIKALDKRLLIVYIRRVLGVKINIRIVTREHTEIQVLTIDISGGIVS